MERRGYRDMAKRWPKRVLERLLALLFESFPGQRHGIAGIRRCYERLAGVIGILFVLVIPLDSTSSTLYMPFIIAQAVLPESRHSLELLYSTVRCQSHECQTMKVDAFEHLENSRIPSFNYPYMRRFVAPIS
jgi:hypothetical protein